MSLDEAHLILNVKKEDPLEIIEKVIHQSRLTEYDRTLLMIQNFATIFKANGPPAEPAPTAKPTPPPAGSRQTPAGRKSKQPNYSHYLQSKVYRALERIKAERDVGAPPPDGGEGATAAAGAEGAASTAAPGTSAQGPGTSP